MECFIKSNITENFRHCRRTAIAQGSAEIIAILAGSFLFMKNFLSVLTIRLDECIIVLSS